MHRKVAVALVAALALAVASCGGSESETLTRAQLVRRIETACKEGQREGTKQARASGGANGQQAFIAALLAGQKKELDALNNVKSADAAKADYEAFKEGVQARVAVIERVASADIAHFASIVRAAQPTAEAISKRVEAAIRRLGVVGCQ
jgi:cytosine/adenosine deaminase-related metal-dependent hydrolase